MKKNILIIKKRGGKGHKKSTIVLKRIYPVFLKGKKHFNIPIHTDLLSKAFCEFRCRTYGNMSESQLLAFRRSISRSPKTKKIFKVYPVAYVPRTHKPSQARMGGGKGAKVSDIIYPLRPGQPILKLFKNKTNKFFQTHAFSQTYYKTTAKQALERIFSKLPICVYSNFVLL